jgi:translation initiation factor 1
MPDPRAQDGRSQPVYSTDGGRVQRPSPHNRAVPSARPAAPARPGNPPDDGVVRIQRDSKGRGGKTMTVVTGLPGPEADLDALLRSLKASLGTGGTREGRTLAFQGDQRERLLAALAARGYRPKLAGG